MVNLRRLSFVLLLICFEQILSQNKHILLTIDNDSVSTTEFMKLYNKNLDLVKDESQKDLDNYLTLFVNYKLKIKEAKRLGLDQDQKYQKEFLNYKKQLTKNYISDNKVTDELVKEAYNRMQYDIKASHILIFNSEAENDTLAAYNKLLECRKTILNEGFDAAKAKYHDGSTIVVEDLGYFSVFKMVYDFETIAYNTLPGQVSLPFKTDFGYHIIKVDEKRPTRGTVSVAHIMIALQQQDSLIDPKLRIDNIYKKLQQGESFEALAKQFSDDKSSALNGGKFRPFKSGELSSVVFEDAAFGLEKYGEITKPFKTHFGWHIIKLIDKKPLKSYEELLPQLKAKVKQDSRSKRINSSMVALLEKKYNITKNPNSKDYFMNHVLTDSYFGGNLVVPQNFKADNMVFLINNKPFTNNDFFQFLKSKQRRYIRQKTTLDTMLNTEYKLFYQQCVLSFREENLINENQEFADILNDYRDGLLLFSLMEKEIWHKASNDTIGLKKFYNNNAVDYVWNDRVDVIIANANTKTIAVKVKDMLKKDTQLEEIKSKLNTPNNQNVLFTKGIYEIDNPRLPQAFNLKKGESDIYFHNEGYQVIKVNDILPSKKKTFKEAKGQIISDYQKHLENQWLSVLKSRYKVVVNLNVLNNLKTKI